MASAKLLFIALLVSFICVANANDADGNESTTLTLKILNGVMQSVLFIFGILMILAIAQDVYWTKNWRNVPFWLEGPNVIPAWLSSINFFIYLGLTDNNEKQKVLLLSVAQFQWIFNNTYSMFVQTYMDMSSDIYMVYDERKINEYESKTKALPQNKYLVHGLFRLLNNGHDFSIWGSRMYRKLPSLHPDILDIFAKYINEDLYKFPDLAETRDLNQAKRDKIAKCLLAIVTFITFGNIIVVAIAWYDAMLIGFMMVTIGINGLMCIFHLIFSIRTVGVLRYLQDGKHLGKYKTSLACSWIVMITEFAILGLFIEEGIRDDLRSINSLILIHSIGLWGWYTIWIVETVYVAMGKYDNDHW